MFLLSYPRRLIGAVILASILQSKGILPEQITDFGSLSFHGIEEVISSTSEDFPFAPDVSTLRNILEAIFNG